MGVDLDYNIRSPKGGITWWRAEVDSQDGETKVISKEKLSEYDALCVAERYDPEKGELRFIRKYYTDESFNGSAHLENEIPVV